jgi:hypothetical protein
VHYDDLHETITVLGPEPVPRIRIDARGRVVNRTGPGERKPIGVYCLDCRRWLRDEVDSGA